MTRTLVLGSARKLAHTTYITYSERATPEDDWSRVYIQAVRLTEAFPRLMASPQGAYIERERVSRWRVLR